MDLDQIDAIIAEVNALTIRQSNGNIRPAELHWYESHGVGKRNMKIKRLLD